MKSKFWIASAGSTYSIGFLVIFLGSLLLPFISVSPGLSGLLNGFKSKTRFINTFTEARLLLGDQVFNRTLAGNDGWLYLTGDTMASYQRVQPFSRRDLIKIRALLEEFQQQVQTGGGVLVFVVPPDKQTIYPEHMPSRLPRGEGASHLDQLITYLAKSNSHFPLLDLRPALLEAKPAYPLYYTTDSHWNPFGAFIAYQQIIKALQPAFPDLTPHSLSEYKVKTGGPIPLDLSRTMGSTSRVEGPFELVPIHGTSASIISIDVVTRLGPHQIYFSQTDDKRAPTALIFDDSFSFALRPFLSEHFSRAVYIDYLVTPEISFVTWYQQFQPDIVIFEVTERNIQFLSYLFGG